MITGGREWRKPSTCSAAQKLPIPSRYAIDISTIVIKCLKIVDNKYVSSLTKKGWGENQGEKKNRAHSDPFGNFSFVERKLR